MEPRAALWKRSPKKLFYVSCSKSLVFSFIKKDTLAQVLFCELCGILKSTYFVEHRRMAPSDFGKPNAKQTHSEERVFSI